jgi:septal ring factor EnvC (AmiA/AmiB activator)
MRTMTPEERSEQIQRQLEFLAASQAQHDARMAEISKTLDGNSRQVAENSRQIAENSRMIAENSRQISQLSDFVLRLGRVVEEGFRRTDERLSALIESQAHTDERLNALINVVERYFSNGRN